MQTKHCLSVEFGRNRHFLSCISAQVFWVHNTMILFHMTGNLFDMIYEVA